LQNKTEENFLSEVEKLSVGKTWPSMWKMFYRTKYSVSENSLKKLLLLFFFFNKRMHPYQTSTTVERMQTVFMWMSKFEVRYIFNTTKKKKEITLGSCCLLTLKR
jgi:hypothetical protein